MDRNDVREYGRRRKCQELPEIGEMPRFTVFHVPHDGNRFPRELMTSLCITKDLFLKYHELMRDQDVGQLIPQTDQSRCLTQTFEISRLLCDVERFIGPEEIMERYGMGFCYEKAYDGKVIKHADARTKSLCRKYYDEHHRRLNELCRQHPRLLLLDMHSYHTDLVPKDFLTAGRKTSDLCIGTDPEFTPPELAETMRNRFEELGLTVETNNPYEGCYVPENVMNGTSGCNFAGIMLEFHRRAYLKENGEVNPEAASGIRETLRKILADYAGM